MENTKSHDLHDFMLQISQEMALEYERIQKRATEDPGTAGDQGEENWADLLRDWLPPTYQIVTKGRIISEKGRTSPQVDLLILKPSYPRKLLNKKVYLSAGVAAAFECKVTLKATHITEALENCIKIKSMFTPRKGTPFKELHTPIIYGLLAHSHSWKGDKSTPLTNIKERLTKDDTRLVDHPRKMIDLICVADLAMWASSIHTYLVPNQRLKLEAATPSGRSLVAQTVYLGHTDEHKQVAHFQPVGDFIVDLFYKLAWENEEYRSIANYFGILKSDADGLTREWNSSVYSNELKAQFERTLLGIDKSILAQDGAWNEWQVYIVK